MMKQVEGVPRTMLMPLKKACVVAFMAGLILLTSLCFLQYQKINQLTTELERLRTENERSQNLLIELVKLGFQNVSALTLETPPTVRVTNGSYNGSLIQFWGCPEHKELSNKTVAWGLENLGRFVSIIAYKAGVLDLNSTEIFQILVNLTFTAIDMTPPIVMLPCLVEKAKHNGVDAWIIVFNWEAYQPIVLGDVYVYPNINHIRIYVVECGTQRELHFESCT